MHNYVHLLSKLYLTSKTVEKYFSTNRNLFLYVLSEMFKTYKVIIHVYEICGCIENIFIYCRKIGWFVLLMFIL